MRKGSKALYIFLLLGICIVSACEEEQEAAKPLWQEDKVLPIESFGVTYYFSDSAHLRAQLETPYVIEKTEENENGVPRLVHHFDKGVKIIFFSETGERESVVTADNGIFRKEEGIAELNKNVVVTNLKQERLETEQLYWDKDIDSVYTHVPVKIQTPDRIITGSKGLRANTNFSAYTLFGIQGEMEMEDELE